MQSIVSFFRPFLPFLPAFLSFLKFRKLYYVAGNTLAVFHRMMQLPVSTRCKEGGSITHPPLATQPLPINFSLYQWRTERGGLGCSNPHPPEILKISVESSIT